MKVKNSRTKNKAVSTNWDPLAGWYDGWVGKEGSEHHRRLAIPAVLELLELQSGESVLDVGAGQGVLAPHILAGAGHYTGIDASTKLLQRARRYHGADARFLLGDATRLPEIDALHEGTFDTAVFLLSIQDMEPLADVIAGATWALRPGGRLVLLITHPCFRVPRQSGWGWDENRKLRYRRVDRYLTPLPVPMKAYPGAAKGVTISFHRPLQMYFDCLADCGLVVNRIKEIATYKVEQAHSKAEELSYREIPLFLALRAIKLKKKPEG